MRILMLQGLYCTSKLWKQAASCLKEHDLLFMEYPHEVTSQAVQVMDLASWIASQLPRDIDVIIGHSMGGILALQLVHDVGVPVKLSLIHIFGLKGLSKKFLIILILIGAVELDRLMSNGTWVFRTLVCYFYIANEGISLLENAGNLGLPVPEKLKAALAQLKDKESEDEE